MRLRALSGFCAAVMVGLASTSVSSAQQLPPLSTPGGSCISAETVAGWPLVRQAGHVVMVGVKVEQSAYARDLVVRNDLAGLILRGVPKRSDAAAIKSIRDAKPLPTIIAVDEEGGRVQHLRVAVGLLPSARKQSAMKPEVLRALIASHAKAMRALGFTMVLGPVVDLSGGPISANGIGDRAYSNDPAHVVVSASAFVDGMLDAGVYPVLKHFPGHGGASGDSHKVGAHTSPWDSVKVLDAVPFERILGSHANRIGVMTSHLYVPGLDDRPVSISEKAVTGVLRNDWRFDGLVMTDSLSMWSIRSNFSAADAAVEALAAGNDLLVYDDEPGVGAIVNRLASVAGADDKLAKRLVQANLRVLRAAGANVCAGALLAMTSPASPSSATSPTSPTSLGVTSAPTSVSAKP